MTKRFFYLLAALAVLPTEVGFAQGGETAMIVAA